MEWRCERVRVDLFVFFLHERVFGYKELFEGSDILYIDLKKVYMYPTQ